MLQRLLRSTGMAVLLAALPAIIASEASAEARVGSNGSITMSGSTTIIYGTAIAGGTVTTNGGASATGGSTNGAPAVSFPAVTACGPPYSSIAGITLGSHASYSATTGALSSSGGSTITLSPGTYCFSSLSLSGNSTLAISGSTTVNITGTWDSSGGSVSNTTNDPNNLVVNSSSTGQVKLTGGTGTYMKVYAPAADVDISGNSALYGSIIGKTITISGGSSIHTSGAYGAKLRGWHEVKTD